MAEIFNLQLLELYRLLLQSQTAWNCELFKAYLQIQNATSAKRLEIVYDPMRQLPIVFTKDAIMDEWPGIFSQAENPLTGEIGYTFHLCGLTDSSLYDQVLFLLGNIN